MNFGLSSIITGSGQVIYPEMVEHVLLNHPALQEAGVIMVQQGTRQYAKAFIVLRSGNCFSLELKQQLAALCRQLILHEDVALEIEVLEKLPRTKSGKLLREMLSHMQVSAGATTAAGLLN